MTYRPERDRYHAIYKAIDRFERDGKVDPILMPAFRLELAWLKDEAADRMITEMLKPRRRIQLA